MPSRARRDQIPEPSPGTQVIRREPKTEGRVAVPPEDDGVGLRPTRHPLRTRPASRRPSGPGVAPRGELVAGGRRLDQPPDQPAAAKPQRWEHVPAVIAAHPGLGRGPVVRLLLRQTPYPARHPNLQGEATAAADGGTPACVCPPELCDPPRLKQRVVLPAKDDTCGQPPAPDPAW
jgi:hypothetical protein